MKRGLAIIGYPPHLTGLELDLTDDETAALERLLSDAIDRDRYPLSPRIKMLRGILAKIRPASPKASLALKGLEPKPRIPASAQTL